MLMATLPVWLVLSALGPAATGQSQASLFRPRVPGEGAPAAEPCCAPRGVTQRVGGPLGRTPCHRRAAPTTSEATKRAAQRSRRTTGEKLRQRCPHVSGFPRAKQNRFLMLPIFSKDIFKAENYVNKSVLCFKISQCFVPNTLAK